jgi:RNA polymerase sigma factor (sigma-70 family)
MDADLLRAFRGGDRETLANVYRLCVRDVELGVRRALASLRLLSAANLADIVQEVFLRAFSRNARLSYDGQRDYKPYVLSIARNVVVDWTRRVGREIPTSDLLEMTAGDIADADSGDVTPFPPAAVSLVAGYVQSLPPDLRAVHHRRFVLAEPQRQAAAALGISRQSLRTREQNLIVGLRRELRRAGLSDRAQLIEMGHGQATSEPRPAPLPEARRR